MKREIEREVRLSAFELERGDMELLWQRMLALFDLEIPLRSKISLSLASERLTFDTMQELIDYKALRGRVTKFTFEIRQGQSMVSLSSGSLFSTAPTLKVEGESDVWCAGAIEAVLHVVRQRRAWHFWLKHVPFTPVFFGLVLVPWLKIGPFQPSPSISLGMLLTWLAMTIVFGYFSIYKSQLIPAASITFTRELGFIRRYAGELGLILGVFSLIVAVYMWLIPYGT